MGFDLGTATRLAARGVRRDLPTAAVTALTLAIGIGASTTLLGLVTGATRDLPVPEGSQIVRIDLVVPEGAPQQAIAAGDLERWRESAASIVQVATARAFGTVFFSPRGYASRESAAALSAEMLEALRVDPLIGRFPQPGEDGVVVSWDLWQREFEGDRGAIGSEVRLDGVPRALAGVMPEGFRFPLGQDVWVVEEERLPPDAEIVARLADGGSPESASGELQSLWQSVDPARGREPVARVRVRNYTGSRGESGEAIAFAALGSIVLALLVVACVNGSTLLLLRASRRGHVAGVQLALGASRLQVGVQLLLEATLIAVAGGIAGLGLTWMAVRWVDRVLSVHFGYYWMRMAIDTPVLASTLALVTFAAVLAGALPAWRAMHANPADVLRSGARGRGVGRAGSVFLTLQVAGATAALVGGVLLGAGLGRWGSWREMLPERPIVYGRVELAGTPYEHPAAAAAWRERWLEQMAPLPAAAAAGIAGFGERAAAVETEGAGPATVERRGRVFWNAVTPGYFHLMGVATVAGRELTPADDDAAAAVAVVNEAFVARYLNGANPLQSRLRLDGGPWLQVVGVVAGADVTDAVGGARVYLPLDQAPLTSLTLLVGAGTDVGGAIARMRDAARQVDADVPIDGMRTLEDFFAYLTRVPRTIATVGMAGAAAGLLTMLVGLFGLLSFDVRQRAFEIGVRMAMGADAASIARTVVRRALVLLMPGVVGGLALMYGLAPLFGIFLFGADPRAPMPFIVVGTAMLLVGLLAALAPARDAARVQPADVLRGK